MTPFGASVDSFKQFDELFLFLHRPLTEVIDICSEDVKKLKWHLGSYIQSLKGEIRGNCQAHDKQRNADIYLKSIASKLKSDLLIHLLGQEVDLIGPKVDWDDDITLFYPTDGRTPIEEKFVKEIKNTFKNLFQYIKDIEREGTGSSRRDVSSKREKKKRKIVYPTAYTLDPNVDIESFKEAFEYLKSNNVISEETTEDQFLACFSGGNVEHKVKWKTEVALKDFIDQVNRKEFIEPIPKRLWTTAVECFTNYYGKTFNSFYLGKTETAGHSKSTKIIEAVSYIKKHVNKKHVN